MISDQQVIRMYCNLFLNETDTNEQKSTSSYQVLIKTKKVNRKIRYRIARHRNLICCVYHCVALNGMEKMITMINDMWSLYYFGIFDLKRHKY